jgi:predicted phosphodiesterase
MRCYAVLSDVHANISALHEVLREIDRRKIEDVLFLGDAVGYGPNPNECVDLLAERCTVLLAGNHDWGAIGLTDVAYFNTYARDTLAWMKAVITEKNKIMLGSLPVRKELVEEDILLVHSTPKEPEAWHYLLTLWDAEINFHYFDNRFCFLGHSHQPFIIEQAQSGELAAYKGSAKIKDGNRYIINAGSVGQPRDGDPRAGFVIITDENIEVIRVSYDIVTTQHRMKQEHLSDRLIERLSIGR